VIAVAYDGRRTIICMLLIVALALIWNLLGA